MACAGALACSSGDDAEGANAPDFGGTAPGAGGSSNAGAGGAMGSQTPTGVQGTPEQNGALRLAPGGSAVPAENGVTGGPPGSTDPDDGMAAAEPPSLDDVLVFTRTLAYRHDAIGAGVEAIRAMGTNGGFAVTPTEDPTLFSDDGLAGFDVVVFLNTTADVLDDSQQAAFERFIRSGGGWVGVHAASDTEYSWPWYGQLLGGNAWFKSHPEIQTVTVDVENAAHASTAHLPATFQLQDEWYNFQANPRASVSVLLTLDESSYSPGVDAMGDDHPIAWFHEFDGGRAWYTALGHRAELYQDPVFTQHLLGGIRWAAGVAP